MFKKILFAIAVACTGFGTTVFAQNINLQLKDVTVQDALTALTDAGNWSLILNPQEVDLRRKVDVSAENAGVNDVLRQIFAGQDVSFSVNGKTISVTPSKAARGQLKSVGGVVTDADGEVLVGASLLATGTSKGFITDAEGRFAISGVDFPAEFVVSYLGFLERRIVIDGTSSGIVIALEADSSVLDDVVVIGYGTMRRSMVANAVSKLSIDESKQRPVSSPTDLLNGRVAGVTSFASSGALGAGERVSIRGASSIQAGNDPLYVVDGVIIDATKSNIYNFGEDMSPLAILNTNDIESIEILKDAASAAIYGSRASNGVVVITTKSGGDGKASFRVNISTGLNQFPNRNRVRMSTTEQYLKAYNAGIENYNVQTGKTQARLSLEDLSTTDWLSYAEQLGYFVNADLSVSGGNKKTNFYVGSSYNHNTGIIQTNRLDKFNFSAKVNHNFAKWLEVGTNNSANYMKNHQVPGVSMGSMILGRCMLQRPCDKAYNEDGSYTVGGTAALTYHNPASILNEADTWVETYRYIGSWYATLKFLDDRLTFRNAFNIDFTQNHDYKNYSSRHPYVKNFNVVDYNQTIRNLTLDSILSYNDVFVSGKLNFNAMLGHSFQSIYANNLNIYGKTVPSDSFDVISATATIGGYGGDIREYAMESYFARMNFSYEGKYIFGVTIRADGSSKFEPSFKNRWGWFPSVSAAWNVAREDFMKGAKKVISDLKIRASYGQTGNQAGISTYAYQAKMSSGFNYNSDSGIAVTDFGNPSLRWEKSSQVDVGFDMSLFGEKLSFIVDAYYKKTTDLLYNKPIYTTSGVSSILSNIGAMQNTGIEVTIGSELDFGEFHWSTNLNLASNANKILSLIDGEDIIIGSNNNTTYGTRRILRAGYPLGTFFLYKHDGLYQSDDEVPAALYAKGYRAGDIKYRDVDNNGNLDDKDCMPMGRVTPKLSGGWNNTFSWRNWDLNIFFTFSLGNQIYAGQAFNYTKISYKANSMAKYATNYWTPGSGENWYPRPYYNGSLNQLNSDFFLHDASFLRLRNVSLAYRFPSKLLDKAKIKGLRIYFSVDNAFLVTSYNEGWDPEVNTNNDARYIAVDNFNIPQPRVYSLGMNFTF